jgi:hypothetical protein
VIEDRQVDVDMEGQLLIREALDVADGLGGRDRGGKIGCGRDRDAFRSERPGRARRSEIPKRR